MGILTQARLYNRGAGTMLLSLILLTTPVCTFLYVWYCYVRGVHEYMKMNAGKTYAMEKRRLILECEEMRTARGFWKTHAELMDVYHLFMYIVLHRCLGSHVYNPVTLIVLFWIGGLWAPIKHGIRYWQYRCIRSLRHHLGSYDHKCRYGR